MNFQVDSAARAAATSRAAFTAVVGAAFVSAELPPEEHWEALIVGSYRTLLSLEVAMKMCTTFATAQLGCAAIRGQGIGHLFQIGHEVHGEKVWSRRMYMHTW